MTENVKSEIKNKMKGNFPVLFLLSVTDGILFLLKKFCIIFFLYLIISGKNPFGRFYFNYFLIPVFFAVEYLYSFVRIKTNVKYCSLFDYRIIKKGYSFRYVVKYSFMNLYITLKKLCCFIFYMFPCGFVTAVMYYLLKKGITPFLAVCFCVSDVILLITGVISFAVDMGKYSFSDYCFLKNRTGRIKSQINGIYTVSDKKCRELFKIKVGSVKYLLPCLFVFPSVYYIPFIKMTVCEYVCRDKKTKGKAIVYLALSKNDNYKSIISRPENPSSFSS